MWLGRFTSVPHSRSRSGLRRGIHSPPSRNGYSRQTYSASRCQGWACFGYSYCLMHSRNKSGYVFLFAILVGIGGTLAWQSYSDQGMDLVRAKAPSLAEWFPASSTNRAAAIPATSAAEAPRQLRAGLAPADQQPTPIAPAGAAEIQQQLEPITVDLVALRQTTEQLAANQEKMAQSIARLEVINELINRRVSSLTLPTPVVHAPSPKPVQDRTQASAQPPSRPIRVAPPPRQ